MTIDPAIDPTFKAMKFRFCLATVLCAATIDFDDQQKS